jgi:hypothetical protein
MRSNKTTLLSIMILLGVIPIVITSVSGNPQPSRSDEGIVTNPEWMGIPSIQEDSIPFAVSLDGPSGPFINISDNITEYRVAAEGSSIGWVGLNTSLAYLSIIGEMGSHALLIEPHTDASGLLSFTLIAIGENSTCNRTTALKINGVNDPPSLSSIIIQEREHKLHLSGDMTYYLDLEGVEKVDENSYFNFTINGTHGDLMDDEDSLHFQFDSFRSDKWETRPQVGSSSGKVTLFASTNDWKVGNGKLVFNVRDSSFIEMTLIIDLVITHVNQPPSISISPASILRWEQYETVNLTIDTHDEDSPGPLEIMFNLHSSIDGEVPSLVEQLPYANLELFLNIGILDHRNFWMDLSDPFIWKAGSQYLDEVQVFLTFQVTDNEGDSSNTTIMLELVDINEPPVISGSIQASPTDAKTGERVTFLIDEANDPDGDDLTYVWDFGDGSTGEGRVVEHIYYNNGFKTIQCWVSDGNSTSSRLAIRIEIQGKSYDPWYDLDNDGDGVLNRDDDFPNDRAASKDSDGDKFPDDWNPGYNRLDSTMSLSLDMFPHDRTEWLDTDGDGHGDNKDEFPHDRDEWKDSDGDGIGDNGDTFPNTPNEDVKWYFIGGLVAMLVIAALSLFIIRNSTSRYENSYQDDEE